MLRTALAAFAVMSLLAIGAEAQEAPAPGAFWEPSVTEPAPVSPPEPAVPTTITTPAEDTTEGAEDFEAGELEISEGPILPDELSPLGMCLAADIVVKLVMIGLAFASVLTWTIALAKSTQLAGAVRKAKRGQEWIAEAGSLEHATMRSEKSSRSDVVARLCKAAMEEVRLSPRLDLETADGIKERVASRLSRIEAAAGRQMAKGTGLLATIGSTAPFVGLFGTVWGIMNSFIGISKAQTTNLAVVAPGIAEALLATAIGLVAAIPAVVIYNMIVRWIGAYRAVLGDASAEILRHVSRDLERWSLGRPAAAAE